VRPLSNATSKPLCPTNFEKIADFRGSASGGTVAAKAHKYQARRKVRPIGDYDSPSHERWIAMLYWAAVFFVIALVAAVFGFGGLAAGAAGIAKILFFAFLVLAVVSLLVGRRSSI
jgi:uncharacterized membrane protein YtjA (UPF0391 family)